MRGEMYSGLELRSHLRNLHQHQVAVQRCRWFDRSDLCTRIRTIGSSFRARDLMKKPVNCGGTVPSPCSNRPRREGEWLARPMVRLAPLIHQQVVPTVSGLPSQHPNVAVCWPGDANVVLKTGPDPVVGLPSPENHCISPSRPGRQVAATNTAVSPTATDAGALTRLVALGPGPPENV